MASKRGQNTTGTGSNLPPSLQRYVECDVLQKFYATLNSSIVDPDMFAAHLIQNEFMTQQTADNKMPLGFSNYRKVGNLLGIVDSHIKTAGIVSREHVRNRFNVFLSILSSALGLQDIADQMAYQCCMSNYLNPL